MRGAAAIGVCLVVALGLGLAWLAGPAPRADQLIENPLGSTQGALADHAHQDNDTTPEGHCHPGLDCAPQVIIACADMPLPVSARPDPERMAGIRLGAGWRFTNDPPPPRYAA